MSDSPAIHAISPRELLLLGATDTKFFCKAFFPNAVRQNFAPFHSNLFDAFEDQRNGRLAFKMFRGSAKTTVSRLILAKRIAYAITRTALFVSASQTHSIKSVLWLKNQIERNDRFTTIFKLRQGNKWTEDWLTIHNDLYGTTTSVIAAGITGQTRGFNIDDYRPDFIVCDDILDEENTNTTDYRSKIDDYFFGSLEKSLAPKSENPNSLIALLQTPFVKDDLIDKCCRDPRWASREYSCFDLEGKSVWPERFPTSELIEDRQSHILNGRLRIWNRDMEVKTIAVEESDFKEEWLRYWHTIDPDAKIPTFMYIDPTPPPSARELASGLKYKDYEVIAVVGLYEGNFFILDIARNKGHDPSWTIKKVFELNSRWRPLRVVVEGVNYQKTLKWILDQEVMKAKMFIPILEKTDKRSKRHRIVQALQGPAQKGLLFVHPTFQDFISQFSSYPDVPHDDDLDAVAGAVQEAYLYQMGEQYVLEEPKNSSSNYSLNSKEEGFYSAP